MGIAKRFSKAYAAFKRPDDFINRYEAANPGNPDRALIPAFVRDARFDANAFTRWELSRKIRYLRRNLWLLQAIEREFKKWTVGPNGLVVIPDSSDPKWNTAMALSYAEFCESPCLDSTGTMAQTHQLLAAEHCIESEVFVNLTRSKLSGQQAVPAIQLIESHRCSTPGSEYSYPKETDEIIDGVHLATDATTGRLTKPKGYWIRTDVDGQNWSFRSTTDMYHVFDTSRIGMFRDITPFAAVINTLEDLNELEQMEMQRAKQNSEVANVITNAAGELDRSQLRRNSFGLGNNPPTPTSPTDNDLDKRINMYRRILGARTIALRTGETFEQVGTENPSASTQWHWRYKIGQVCNCAGIPLILIFPELIENMQGTAVRGIYDNAHEYFRQKFSLFANAARRVFYYYAAWAIQNDPRCANPPADWKRCHVIPPRAVNVDVGRNSAATIAEYQVGITNLDAIAGAAGTTAENLVRKKARNVGMIKQVAAEMSAEMGVEIDPAEISAPIADIGLKLAQAEDPNGDDEPSDPKKKDDE